MLKKNLRSNKSVICFAVDACGVGLTDTTVIRKDQITVSDYIYQGQYDAAGNERDSYQGPNARLFRTIGEGAWGSSGSSELQEKLIWNYYVLNICVLVYSSKKL